MRRFRCDALGELRPGDAVPLNRDELAHLFKILRARPGDVIGLLDGKGGIGLAKVGSDREVVLLERGTANSPERRVHLFFAAPRKQKLDQLLKQAVELGAWKLVPMLCSRSVALPDEHSVKGRWTDLLFEACKQSGNPFIPMLANPVPFETAVAMAGKDCDALAYGSVDATGGIPFQTLPTDVAFFVGPEGGFDDDELSQLEKAGAQPVKIGAWTLRAETAAIGGLALLQFLLGRCDSSGFKDVL